MTRNTPIGVFDSGFGGLTVLKALLEAVPHADYLLLWRYGTASLRLKIRGNRGQICVRGGTVS